MPRAARHERYGAARDVLRVVGVDAEAPGDGEVIVRMEAAPLHIADLRTIAGAPPFAGLPLPRTPGFEGIGRVARTGARVSSLREGDRVFPPLGSGTFREELRCSADTCLPAPDGDAHQLALLTVNAPTAYVMVHDLVPLARGEWIVQNAANSSCGRFVIRLARRAGLRTVSVVRRAAAVEELTGLGGDLVLEDGPDLHARVAAATDGAAIRLALDAVGGPATQRLAECLADGGTVATYGAMGGARCEIDFYLMFRQDIRLVGVSFVRELMRRRSREEIRAIYADLAAQLARGELVARIAATYPLDRVVEACEHAALTGEERDGKVILDLAST